MNEELHGFDEIPFRPRELEAWALRCGLDDLLDRSALELKPFLAWDWFLDTPSFAREDATIRSVVLRGRLGAFAGTPRIRESLLEAAREYLYYHLNWRYVLRIREKRWESPLPDASLRSLSQRLQRQYREIAKVPGIEEPIISRDQSASLDLVHLEATLVIRIATSPSWNEQIEVRFGLEEVESQGLHWNCDCGESLDPCRHLLSSLGFFLDALHSGDSGRWGSLAKALGKSRSERFLEDLQLSLRHVDEREKEEPRERLTWRVGRSDSGDFLVEPYVQKLGQKGRWSPGRRITVQTLSSGNPLVEPEDGKAVMLGRQGMTDYRGLVHCGDMVEALIGHPRVFSHDDPKVKLEIRSALLRIVLAEGEGSGLRFGIEVAGRLPEPDHLVWSSDRRHLVVTDLFGSSVWYIVTIPPAIVGICVKITNQNGCAIGQAEVGMAVEVLTRITAHTEIAVHRGVGAKEMDLRSHPAIEIRPLGEGLEFRAIVPTPEHFGEDLVPGEGSGELFGMGEEGLTKLRRDVAAEREAGERVAAVLGAAGASPSGPYRFEAPAAEQALESLLALGDLEESPELRWLDDAESRRVSRASAKELRVRVSRRGSLFEVGGDIEVDGARIAVASFLQAVRKGESYVRIGPGRFARIERRLRERLETLDRVAAGDGRGKLAAGAAAISRLEEALGDEVEIDGDAGYHKLLARMAAADDFAAPLPEGLTAELRPYQLDGFRWLCRLAHMQTGGILADDMGLGKTVQTLALLLHRAPEGPALVVAPTSVCSEWRDQAARFAPGLSVTIYRGAGRQEALEGLGPGSVLVASYGILRRDAERLRRCSLATLVLDEAQAIKNAATRGSKAARAIEADLVIALTGTPLQNHLGELWAIYRIVSPGLLGSWDHFRRRFAIPIERYESERALEDLAALIRPLLLRRKKLQVAPELPPRTEIVRRVVLSRAERALYEAARLEILEKLAAGKREGEGRFEILAAITRLRQLACHPRLIDRSSSVSSTKMETAGDLIGELVEEGQRALVFSQFTRHLGLLRETLDEMGIAYLYLDGSTPAPMRDRLVTSWRQGGVALFLVSLKAGGTGLNLTGADCVLHLDPWWNPAVEDQATDRTHRIGQERPVTVIRLIAEATIEEAVLGLHEQKRNLARGVLEGAEAAGSLGTRELVELIRSAGEGREASEEREEDRESTLEEYGEEHAQDPAPCASGEETSDPIDLDDLLERFEDALEAEVASDSLSEPTARHYVRVLRRVFEYAREQAQLQLSLSACFTGYSDAITSGKTKAPKSDRTFVPVVQRRLEGLVPD